MISRTAFVVLSALEALASCATAEPRERSVAPIETPVPSERSAPSEPIAEPAREPWTEELRLASAPFDVRDAPSVIVHAGPAFDPARPLRLAIFLHGWTGCTRVLLRAGAIPCRDSEPAHEGWDLAGRFDEGASDALFVVPQLAFMQRDGRAGRFLEEGHLRAFLSEMLAALGARIGGAELSRVESIAIFAHSAAYETALALLARGGVEVRHLVLFDALYRGVEPFLAWAAADPERRLVSLYTGEGRTARQSAMLAGRARTVLGDASVAQDLEGSLAVAVADHRVVVARSPAPHGTVPARHLAELLVPLGLGARENE